MAFNLREKKNDNKKETPKTNKQTQQHNSVLSTVYCDQFISDKFVHPENIQHESIAQNGLFTQTERDISCKTVNN